MSKSLQPQQLLGSIHLVRTHVGGLAKSVRSTMSLLVTVTSFCVWEGVKRGRQFVFPRNESIWRVANVTYSPPQCLHTNVLDSMYALVAHTIPEITLGTLIYKPFHHPGGLYTTHIGYDRENRFLKYSEEIFWLTDYVLMVDTSQIPILLLPLDLHHQLVRQKKN